MAVLTTQQRNTLESAVTKARKLAETGARNVLFSLAVDNPEPFQHMSPEHRALRNRLRNKARLLGDELPASGHQQIDRLSYELAYENWHKMLFAKFLESNDLLMHTSGVEVTMDECEELAKEEGFIDKWEAAATYASKMLPAIFRTDDPLMQVPFASNDRIKLEEIIDALEQSIFTADDALGWVYQFWQSEAKAAINASGDKIDGAKLPAVTQLFTEPYMVHFLIDNTLGAWWVSRNPGVTPPVKFEYLRVAPASSRNNNSLQQDSNSAILAEKNENNNLRQDAGATFSYFNPYEEVDNIIGNLPHWRQEGKLYFVTFRTADSMPQELLKEWESEMEAWKSQNPEPHTPEQKKEYYKRFPAKMQEYLDAGHGACHFKNEEIKIVVENALKFFNGDRYELDEYVVAGNHVHVLVEPKGNNQLSDILHSWKSYTANEIHKITNETGAFWQKESFDHLVRSEASLEKFREYIRKHNVAPASSRSNNNLRQDGGDYLPFEGWPDKTRAVTSLDPCMGSGHFVASLFPVFASLRMYEEGLSKEEATDLVITENLHGLELDARCTQIAAFNLALTAWKFCGHYKELPEMNLACSGIAPKGKVEDWVKLVGKVDRFEDKERMENGMRMLYNHFQLAPELGSLLDPSTIKADAFTASFEQLQPVLVKALEGEADKDLVERGVMAAGIAKAGEILAQKYTLQITNVPYLGRARQVEDGILSNYCLKKYPEAKGDLANVFLEKMLKSNTLGGISCTVMPQNWLFLTTYKKYRETFLKTHSWIFVVRLGEYAFENTEAAGAFACMVSISKMIPTKDHSFFGINAANNRGERPIYASEKKELIKTAELEIGIQSEQLKNPDTRVVFGQDNESKRLSNYAISPNGMHGGDAQRFRFFIWELNSINENWRRLQSTVIDKIIYGGKNSLFFWPEDGRIHNENKNARIQGENVWTKMGVAISLLGNLNCTIYEGDFFDISCSPIVPNDEKNLPAIWCFCSSPKFKEEVRKIDQKLNVTNATIVKVPFDLEYWQKVAEEKYPNGLPKPYSDDATQWLFHGHPIKAENPLQVAVARLLGYRWPAEVNDASSVVNKVEAASSGLNNNAAGSGVYYTLADEAIELIKAVKAFDDLTDGIFCIPSVNAEQAGADRLRSYLQAVFGSEWNNQTIGQLLTKVEAASSSLEDYLRKEFFIQHCKLFQNRPFIWHIWDGRNDGFSALVNYHKLTRENLVKLTYTYLGDWIRMCDAKKKSGESGADGLYSASIKLQEKLIAILEGEAPYDIFVRWKPLEQQPIGWEPDLNDGVRLNIRPFIEAGVLRSKFNLKWGVDRGKNPVNRNLEGSSTSYFSEIRDNDKHIPLAEKRAAREKKK